VLTLDRVSGETLVRAERPFAVPALGDARYELALQIPPAAGKCILKAAAKTDAGDQTVSRRWVVVDTPATR
jgi:hypothetical protein